MSRPRSEKVATIKAKLIARLRDGFQRPGDRFFSTREVAGQYGVSCQTAQRVITELGSEGLIERREFSGTYVAGKPAVLRGVELWFHPRAKGSGCFGAHLLHLLQVRLRESGIRAVVRFAEAGEPSADHYPVIWEAPEVLAAARRLRRYALLLNKRPEPGLVASLIDVVITDDFSAGVCAA